MDDGARITVNGQSSNVAQSVIRVLQSGLPSPYDSAEIPAAGIRRGKPLKEIDVFPVEARFFEKGKEDLRPIWIKKFNN